MSAGKLLCISGLACPTNTADYSVFIQMADEPYSLRCALNDDQMSDLAIRLHEMKEAGAIDDWSIIQCRDLSLAELFGWIIAMPTTAGKGAEA